MVGPPGFDIAVIVGGEVWDTVPRLRGDRRGWRERSLGEESTADDQAAKGYGQEAPPAFCQPGASAWYCHSASSQARSGES